MVDDSFESKVDAILDEFQTTAMSFNAVGVATLLEQAYMDFLAVVKKPVSEITEEELTKQVLIFTPIVRVAVTKLQERK